MAERSTNAPELSVSELSGAIKRTMEDAFGQVRVRGEVSGWRGPHSSGHAYFCLKDDRARLEAVIWKSGFSRLKIRPEEGMEVIATGKVSTFPGSSKYQLVIETLEPAGVGALLAQLEERRKRLAAEGLFAPERKRALPFLPASIGVVTSPTGAVIRDILHRLAERFPRPVLVWPVRVQGDTSAAEVAAAIRGVNALPEAGPIRRPDLLIVARGGGSLEDLWGFNDEAVVRAAAESRIPLISAVGHETDTTLIDHAADRRAPTPTAAAEMAVPVRTELLAALAGLQARREGGLRRLFARRRTELLAAARALPGAEAVLALPRQRTDAAGARLAPALRSDVRFRALALAALSRRLDAQSPRLRLERQRARADGLGERLGRAAPSGPARKRDQLLALSGRLQRALAGRIALERRDLAARDARVIAAHARLAPGIASALRHRATRLAAQHRLMESLGYVAVLKRGFALVRGADGHAVRTAELPGGMPLELEFCDGRVRAVTGERAKAVAVRRSMPQPTLQDSLF